MSDDNIKKFTGKRKVNKPDGSLMLVPPAWENCKHYDGPFEVDYDSGDCKCLACGSRVTAIFVLQKMMLKESRWMQTREAYQEEMKRLAERKKTKCTHCGKMTNISHR